MELVDEIAARGVSAVLEDATDATLDAVLRWLGGERLSARADEPELRVQAAWEARAAFEGFGVFDRLVAQAVLALPPDHDERDPGLARRLLEDHLQASRDGDDAGEELRTITALFSAGFVAEAAADELLARGAALAGDEEDTSGAAGFEIEARGYCVGRYLVARDAGDEATAKHWLERSTAYLPAAPDAGDEDLAAVASLAADLDMAQRWPEAADAYRRLVQAAGAGDPSAQPLAIREGELRLMIGDVAGAAAALAEVLPHVEARYLDAVRDEDVAEAAELLAGAVDGLALAQGRLGEWSALCRTLDRTRGLRLRQEAALRGTADGARRLDAGRQLQAALRGAPDSAPPAGLLEAYRRLRPAGLGELASPLGLELASALQPGEAVVFLAHHFTGTVAAVVVAGPVVEGFVRDDFATADWILALAPDGDEPGWIDMLTDPAAATPGAGLQRLIDAADAGVGGRLRERFDAHAVGRVTVLAEDILQLVPWWALPSFDRLEVLTAGSAADLLRDRLRPPPPAPRTALVVSDPTLDLPVTAVACERVCAVLRRCGVEPGALSGRAATEPAVLAGLPGRTLLHFGGHGRSDVAYSALELQADPPPAADPFPAWLAEVETWRSPEEESDPDDPGLWTHRWADLPARGRLHERQWLASGRLDRWLEHRAGTIAATYRDGACVRVSELWSAADLLVGDAMRDCRLAVLTACESGVAGRGEDSRALGLPAGLAFAGVGTVVGSLWPVDESLAALWGEAFYAGLAAELDAGQETVNVAALVQGAAARTRGLSRDDAAGRLLALAGGTTNPIARFLLEADAARLDDPPYAAAHHWAAFYVTGHATVTFEGAAP